MYVGIEGVSIKIHAPNPFFYILKLEPNHILKKSFETARFELVQTEFTEPVVFSHPNATLH